MGLTLIKSVLVSYWNMRIPGLFPPSMTPGNVVIQGVTPGVRNIALMGDPVKGY